MGEQKKQTSLKSKVSSFAAAAVLAASMIAIPTQAKAISLGDIIGAAVGAGVASSAVKGNSGTKAMAAAGGAVIGGLLGGTVENSIKQQQQPQQVIPPPPPGYGSYEGQPIQEVYRGVPANEATRCQKFHETVVKDGQVVSDTIREVCKGEKITASYDDNGSTMRGPRMGR